MAAILGLSQGIMIRDYQQLENQYAVTNVKRAWAALQDEINRLMMIAGDWAQWDDTKDFVLGHKPEYIASNLTDSSLVTIQIHLMIFWDEHRKCVSVKGVNLKDKVDWSIPAEVVDTMTGRTELFDFREPTDSAKGIVQTSCGPILIAARPITNSAVEKPIYGTLLVGRLLDNTMMEKLAAQTHLDLCLIDRSSQDRVNTGLHAFNLSEPDPIAIQVYDSHQIRGYRLIGDLAKQNNLALQVTIPRDIIRQGKASVLFFLISLGWIGFLGAVAIWFLLQCLVLNPLGRLTGHVVTIARTGDLNRRLEVRSNDEMGILARQFNDLTEQLYRIRKQVTEQSFLSGMSEMASGVLHNLRNALTPITSEIENLCREVDQVPVQHLRQAVTELARSETEPDRREKLVQFVNSGRDNLIAMVSRFQDHLDKINRPLVHVDQILADQQRYCSNPAALETLTLVELIQDATSLVDTQLLRSVQIIVHPSVENVDPITVPRIQMVQVISNLLINAAESIHAAGRSQGHITFESKIVVHDPDNQIHLIVHDDGGGFTPEIQDRLFERGFSTKGKSNWGLGLHWCANVLGAMHGRIHAESNGSGCGAIFRLIWPIPKSTSHGEWNANSETAISNSSDPCR